jgi:hypothetical protein
VERKCNAWSVFAAQVPRKWSASAAQVLRACLARAAQAERKCKRRRKCLASAGVQRKCRCCAGAWLCRAGGAQVQRRRSASASQVHTRRSASTPQVQSRRSASASQVHRRSASALQVQSRSAQVPRECRERGGGIHTHQSLTLTPTHSHNSPKTRALDPVRSTRSTIVLVDCACVCLASAGVQRKCSASAAQVQRRYEGPRSSSQHHCSC